MSTLNGPYLNTGASDTDHTGALAAPVLETTLTASQQPVDIGGVTVNAEVFNGEIPGPTFRLTVGQTVVVRLVNNLPYEIGIHWHGVELENYSDGTEVTQDGAVPLFTSPPPAPAPAGGTFLYKFKVSRAGLFWYHPHHGNSINRVFRGLYGMIIVTDPLEENLITSGVLPAAEDTMELVLSDITVCKAAGSNDSATYPDPTDTTVFPDLADAPEWRSEATAQNGPSPTALCEIAGSATDDDGAAATADYNAGDVPSIMRPPTPGTPNFAEGQTVLTNGVNVGGRLGTPAAPGELSVDAETKDVLSGQGLRLQIVNCATLRYFLLLLTTEDGTKVDLMRIGGEGGLLDEAILEGGTIGTIDTLFESGEILLPPGTRADVVAAIPTGLTGTVLTLWTRDYQHTGGILKDNWAQIPTVPVMHLNVTGDAATTYTISAGDALRDPAGMPAVEELGGASASLLDPAVIGKTGSSSQDIQVKTSAGAPSIDEADAMPLMESTPYTDAPHIDSSRYASQTDAVGDATVLELTVTNASEGSAHHPFHLHGFSFQPISFEQGGVTSFAWPYQEFRDTIDLFPSYMLRFRLRLDDRELADGVTLGGAMGRWFFHCHIFFHHEQGMLSELVVTDSDGIEKPNVNVGGSWAYTSSGGIATRDGTFYHRDGLVVELEATLADGTAFGVITYPPGVSSGTWSWELDSTGLPDQFTYVYITATDSDGRKDQAVFRLQIGGTDAGSDVGDPHIYTVDGKRYDFQAAGEFTLLRDREGMEIQARQTPVETPPPITDDYTDLTECVSVNTAVAARVGTHRIALQQNVRGGIEFYLDGKLAQLTTDGIDLDAHRVSAFDADGEIGLRVDYAHGPVLLVTPAFWSSYGLSYMNVDVSNTQADEGLMGRIYEQTWLPALPSGATVGPMPQSLHDRYVALYQTFANAWRVTDETSLFVYEPGTSTATFTDEDWPPEKPPCTTVKPGFPVPVTPIKENIPIARAKQICKGVKLDDLHAFCVFDVATTGDESFAKRYLVAQDLRLCGTAVQVVGDRPQTRPGQKLVVTATVLPRTRSKKVSTGSITFIIDGKPVKPAIKLNKDGRARLTVALKLGEHKIRAAYTPGRGENTYHSSSSPNLLHTVTRRKGAGYGVTKPADHTMTMDQPATGGRGSKADLHIVAKRKKPSPPTHRAHKKRQ